MIKREGGPIPFAGTIVAEFNFRTTVGTVPKRRTHHPREKKKRRAAAAPAGINVVATPGSAL